MRAISNVLLPSIAVAVFVGAEATVRAGVAYVTNFADGTIDTVPNGGGAATTFCSGLSRPFGITLGPNGTVYVANQLTGEIDSVSKAGTATKFATVSYGARVGIAGLTADPTGNLYVSSPMGGNSGVVYKVAPTGGVTTYATGLGDAEGLSFGGSGVLYVADLDNNRIDMVPPGGGTATAFAALASPVGIATDAAGNVYASSSGGYVEQFSAAGADLGRYGTVPHSMGMAFGDAGDLLVASSLFGTGTTTAYAIAPGGGTVTTYATGLNGPFFIATVVPEPTALGAVAAIEVALLARRRRR